MALTSPQFTAQRTLDAEQAVVGSMLRSDAIIPQVLAKVDPADFLTPELRTIFEAIRMLFREGKPVDGVTVRNVVGESYSQLLVELLEVTPSAANWEAYADAMHEQAALRRIRSAGEALAGATRLQDCQQVVSELIDVFSAGRAIEARTISDLIRDFAARQGETKKKEYLPFGIRSIDAYTYAEKGDVVMIGGAPSDGKTAFALTAAYRMAEKHNVGFFSLETSMEKLEDRLVSSGFQIDFSRIKRQDLKQEDWDRFAEGSTAAAQRRLTVLRGGGMTAEQIASVSRARGFDVVFIDYVQLIKSTAPRGASRAEQMAEVSMTLHTFAQTSGIMVVELAQLRRPDRPAQANRKTAVPQRDADMFDIGESSQFERDADLILLLYRPRSGTRLIEGDETSELLDEDHHRILRVAKNKEGMRGKVALAFDGAHQTFHELDGSRGTMRKLIAEGRAAKTRSRTDSGQLAFSELSETGDLPF